MTTDTRPTTPPIEVVTPLKASEAMRLGCLTTAPLVGGFGDGEHEACAVGAMLIGFGVPLERASLGEDIDRFLDAGRYYDEPCPGCVEEPMAHGWVSPIFRLNDDHRWSRERIADWLEGLGL